MTQLIILKKNENHVLELFEIGAQLLNIKFPFPVPTVVKAIILCNIH